MVLSTPIATCQKLTKYLILGRFSSRVSSWVPHQMEIGTLEIHVSTCKAGIAQSLPTIDLSSNLGGIPFVYLPAPTSVHMEFLAVA